MSGSRIQVMHGVNLDTLGRRDPQHYGTITLAELERRVGDRGRELGLECDFFHTNSEREFVERLHGAPEIADALLLNPGAWTHYSYAIRDALEATELPAVEVHLSDVDNREPWRSISVFDGLVIGRIAGQGPAGYDQALAMLSERLAGGADAAP